MQEVVSLFGSTVSLASRVCCASMILERVPHYSAGYRARAGEVQWWHSPTSPKASTSQIPIFSRSVCRSKNSPNCVRRHRSGGTRSRRMSAASTTRASGSCPATRRFAKSPAGAMCSRTGRTPRFRVSTTTCRARPSNFSATSCSTRTPPSTPSCASWSRVASPPARSTGCATNWTRGQRRSLPKPARKAGATSSPRSQPSCRCRPSPISSEFHRAIARRSSSGPTR